MEKRTKIRLFSVLRVFISFFLKARNRIRFFSRVCAWFPLEQQNQLEIADGLNLFFFRLFLCSLLLPYMDALSFRLSDDKA